MSVPTTDLTDLGWDDGHVRAFAPHAAGGLTPGRVVVGHREAYLVRTPLGEWRAAVSGRFRFEALGATDFPAVGDWVAVARHDPGTDEVTIHAVLARRSAFVRRAPGRGTSGQVVAANVDLLLIATSLNRDLNLRRLERYLALGRESGAAAAIVLSKADLCTDEVALDGRRRSVEAVAPGTTIVVLSAVDGRGMSDLHPLLVPGRTVALIGSSGVGKSTLVNALAGEDLLPVREIRLDDARGRHTTSRRQLVRLAGGALMLDTPGMRELGVLDEAGLGDVFGDIDELASTCRFSNCSHLTEPGCAIIAAIEDGSLSRVRLESRRKLEREVARARSEKDPRARAEERRRHQLISASVARHMRRKYGNDGLS